MRASASTSLSRTACLYSSIAASTARSCGGALDTLAAGSVAVARDGVVGVAGSERPQAPNGTIEASESTTATRRYVRMGWVVEGSNDFEALFSKSCLLYTSDAADERS